MPPEYGTLNETPLAAAPAIAEPEVVPALQSIAPIKPALTVSEKAHV